MIRFNKDKILNLEYRIYKWLSKGEGLPTYGTITDNIGAEHRLKPKEYAGLMESMNIFRIHNGRDPNYVDLVSKANNPLVFDHQDNKYNCCPASLAMASQLLYHYKSESECARVLGTGTNGTSPQQLIDGAPKLGFRAVPIKRDPKEVIASLNKCYPVICHFQTDQTKNCMGDYIGAFGHYSLIWNYVNPKYIIADPAKSVHREYYSKCMDQANKGYRENYYSIQPLPKE